MHVPYQVCGYIECGGCLSLEEGTKCSLCWLLWSYCSVFFGATTFIAYHISPLRRFHRPLTSVQLAH